MRFLLLLPLLFLTGCGIEQINEGSRGIETHWGKVVGDPLSPGLYFYNPISSNIFEMSVREEKMEGTTECFTRDTQNVKISYAVTFYPNPANIGKLYSQFGRDWAVKTVAQSVLASMKDAVGQYDANDLVGKREAATLFAQQKIKEALESRGITVTRLDMTNLDFDDAYEKAVEAKVTAIQNANAEKNRTAQIDEQAKQKIKMAEAEARAMQIQTQALQQSKTLVQYEAVKRWDGKLPQYMFGNSTPILNVGSLKAE